MAGKMRPTKKPDDPEAARQYATWLLSGRPRTARELRDAMVRKGFDVEMVDEIVDRYANVGMIDDALFAKMWVDSRHRGRGLSRSALRSELRRKGVEDEHIQEAVDSVTAESEREAAKAIAQRKFRSVARLEEPVIVRRLVGALARRGYGPGVAIPVVKEVLAEAELEAAEELREEDFETPHD
ncbi:regulatory protein RecX [Salininema proteolyticum]|uniref:Regulatory protein RecX n=1 Tax=Salininema proteolyticum TaxID=1607685 RepID=A0ABV8TYD0_9ACTN